MASVPTCNTRGVAEGNHSRRKSKVAVSFKANSYFAEPKLSKLTIARAVGNLDLEARLRSTPFSSPSIAEPYSSVEIPPINEVLTPRFAKALAVFAAPPPTVACLISPCGSRSISASPATHANFLLKTFSLVWHLST